MSKREAETYLTDRNWDEDEEPDEPGVFATASEEIIKQRPILKAKRRCGSGTSGTTSNAFQGFSFTGLAASAKLPDKQAPERVPSETMDELNKNLLSSIQERVSKEPQCDLSPLLVDYCEQAKQLVASAKASVPLSQLFSKAPNTWDCTVCMVNNKNSDVTCVSCSSPKPAVKSSSSESVSVVSKESEASAGISATCDESKPSLGELFKKSGGEWDCRECFVRNKAESTKCVACETAKPSSGGVSSIQTSLTTETSSSSSSQSSTTTTFSFANSGGFVFKPAANTGDAPKLNFGFTPSSAASGFSFKLPTSTSAIAETTADADRVPPFGFQFGSSSSSSAVSSTSATQGFSFKLPDSTAAANNLSTQGFSFKPPENSSTEPKPSGSEDDEDYVPPKAESVQHTEEDAFYTVKCKLFYKKDDAWLDRGIGNLFLKPCNNKTQLLIRTDTSIGNILLNVLLSSKMPLSRQGTNNVSLVCAQNPPLESSSHVKSNAPVCMLIRVKTSDVADELFKQLSDCKARATD